MRLKLGDQTWGRMPVTLGADQSLRQARGESGPSHESLRLDAAASGLSGGMVVGCGFQSDPTFANRGMLSVASRTSFHSDKGLSLHKLSV